jgi:hypothetical protein
MKNDTDFDLLLDTLIDRLISENVDSYLLCVDTVSEELEGDDWDLFQELSYAEQEVFVGDLKDQIHFSKAEASGPAH